MKVCSGFRVLAGVLFCLLALCLQSDADQAKDDFKRGAQLEKEGQLYRAAETYLRALRMKPGDQKTRAALSRVVDQAIAEKLSTAAALESELKLDEAIAATETARKLLEQLTSLKIEFAQPNAVETRKAQLVNRRVQGLLLEADRAREDGLWSASVAHLQQVESLSPGYGDTREKMREVWVAWADTNVREGRLRAAAERLEQAALVPGEGSGVTSSRAAAVRSVLGMSELRKGACRAAVSDLRVAERLAPGSVTASVFERATACARSCVQIRVSTDADSGISENQLGLLRAELRRQVVGGASEFLLLGDSGAGSRRECEQRRVPGVDGQSMTVGPYLVLVRITALSILRQPASSFTKQARLQQNGGADTIVTYEEYVEVLSGSLSGWVTVTDQRAGSASLPMPVRVTGETLSRWQGNPVSTSTTRDGPGGQRVAGMMIGGSGNGKPQAEEARRQARSHLTETLVQSFASEAGRLLLSTVDVEPAVADPTSLAIAE